MTPAEKLAKKLKSAASAVPHGSKGDVRRPPKYRCRILELRNALGLTQAAVANAIGSHGPVINDAEHGREVSLATALKVAAFFGKPIEEIWEPLPK